MRIGVEWGKRLGYTGRESRGSVRRSENLQPRTPPRFQMRPRAVPKPSPRWAAIVVLMTSRGWPRVVTSNMLRPAPRSKLENLMGFFSSFFGAGAGTDVATADIAWRNCYEGALTK